MYKPEFITHNQQLTTRSRGFTLVEVMISTTLFTVAVILSLGAVLSANAAYQRASAQRALMDNISYIMEDMTRNLRLGSNFDCGGTGGDCKNGSNILSFTDVSGVKKATYYITNDNSGIDCYIGKSSEFLPVDINLVPDVSVLTSPEIKIDCNKSGFIVVGVSASGGGSTGGQPLVVIKIAGKVMVKDKEVNFNLETAVSQR